jgi:hypothetical protein
MRLISDFTAAIRLRRNTIAMEGRQLSTPRAYKRSPALSNFGFDVPLYGAVQRGE